MDDLRIQIVNYKTKEYLATCLRSVFEGLEGSGIKYTVAILDNASGEDLSNIPNQFPGQSIEIHQNPNNVGFGAGHNILAKTDTARYLLFLNPDTEIRESNTVRRLLDRAKMSKAEVVGPRLMTAAGRTQRWDHGELQGLRARVAMASGHSSWRERTGVTEAAWVSGAAFLIKKDWFDRLGGFDENFFLYTEELELCWRLRAVGGKIIYDPTITMLHHGGVVAKKSEHQRASNEYFLQKHLYQRWDYPLLRLLNRILN